MNRPPEKGDIWRSRNGWERHVIRVGPADIRYIQVAFDRKNIDRVCLPVVWNRWVRKSGAEFVGIHSGKFQEDA